MYHIYNLSGLWCTVPNNSKIHGKVKVFQRSNKNLKNLLTDIGIKCWKNQESKDAYVNGIIRQIKKSMEDPNVIYVYVIGHSYGGYVASEAVLSLKNHHQSHKLHVNTYASIYLLPKAEYIPVYMKQYMNKGDLALRCNSNRGDIIWRNTKQSNNIIDEWKIHMNYPLDKILDHIIKKLNSL